MTAANERVWGEKFGQRSATVNRREETRTTRATRRRTRQTEPGGSTYSIVSGTLDLLSQAHQQNLGPRVGPAVLQVFLGLGADAVVGRLQGLQELGELGVDVGGKDRHDCERWQGSGAVQPNVKICSSSSR